MTKSSGLKDGRSKKRPGLEEQTELIVKVAVELFAERGTQSVSISQICEHADISRPTFYRCFPDKETLLTHIYEESVNKHVGEILRKSFALDKGTLDDALDKLFEGIFAQSHLAQLVFVESNDPNSPAAKIVDDAFEHAAETLQEALKPRSQVDFSKVYLKSVMAAIQWIVHNAIKKGMTESAIKEAKLAASQLVSKAFMS